MEKFADREAAGKHLAKELLIYHKRKDVIVLALPRGGVPVAFEIAKALEVPLDVFIVRKLGVPGQEELAMGALAMGNVTVFNQSIIRDLNISKDTIEAVIRRETVELNRREIAYRGSTDLPGIANKVVILVDDGIATGATMRAAIKALRHLYPTTIVIAVPVAEKKTAEAIAKLVDKMICLACPSFFYAVGAWYDNFTQTTDEEVYTLLMQAKSFKNENRD